MRVRVRVRDGGMDRVLMLIELSMRSWEWNGMFGESGKKNRN